MQTGSIIDFYDDPNGMVLKEKVAEAEVPDFIKTAAFLTPEDRQALPDDVFALVMVDQGEKIRKYACVDKGNTALNVMYFLENRDRLPLEAQKVAAANLMTACAWHELAPPEALVKAASKNVLQQLKRLAQPHKRGKLFVAHGGHAPEYVAARLAKQRHGQEAAKAFAKRESRAVAEKSMGRGSRRSMQTAQGKLDSMGKTSSANEQKKLGSMNPYVDVTGQQPPPRFSKRASQRHALDDRFPIDSCGQVKEAEAWFGDHGTSLHPAERRAFCQNLTARADELGMPIDNDNIRKYAGEGYAPNGEIKIAVSTRLQYWAEDSPERDMLKTLMSKTASVPPEVFCESLRQFDEATGMHYHWDDGVCDPWYSTYGFTKTAEWTWDDGNDRLTEDVLRKGTSEHLEAIKKKFGDEVALALQKNPVSIFSSLPLDHQRIISRIINDPQ